MSIYYDSAKNVYTIIDDKGRTPTHEQLMSWLLTLQEKHFLDALEDMWTAGVVNEKQVDGAITKYINNAYINDRKEIHNE
jgi:hypothetical protein